MPVDLKQVDLKQIVSKRCGLDKISLRSFLQVDSKIITLAEMFLVLIVAWQLSQVTWLFFSSDDPVAVQTPRSDRSHAPPDSLRYPQLDGLYVFGKPMIEHPDSVHADPLSIPRSRLQARITGIVTHPDPQLSLAIISSSGSEDSYRTGDRIHRTRATVESIYHDRVVVNNGGQQEALLLYPNEPDRPARQKTVNRVDSTQDSAQKVKALVLNNPQSLMELVNISPVRDGGALSGYRINPRQNPELFHSLGLEPNDLAMSINGFDLTDNQQAMQVFAELPQAKQIVLTVQRDQQLVNIEVSL